MGGDREFEMRRELFTAWSHSGIS